MFVHVVVERVLEDVFIVFLKYFFIGNVLSTLRYLLRKWVVRVLRSLKLCKRILELIQWINLWYKHLFNWHSKSNSWQHTHQLIYSNVAFNYRTPTRMSGRRFYPTIVFICLLLYSHHHRTYSFIHKRKVTVNMQATMSQFTEELTGSAKKKCGVIGAS